MKTHTESKARRIKPCRTYPSQDADCPIIATPPPTTDPWRVRPSVDGLAARGPAGPGSVNRFRRPTVGPVLITARAETVVAADAGSWTARQCESLTDTCSDSWRVGTIAAVSSVCERGARVLQVVDFIREEETQYRNWPSAPGVKQGEALPIVCQSSDCMWVIFFSVE